jgi:regulator of sirC expression with transglutaminase-like and TPR domain
MTDSTKHKKLQALIRLMDEPDQIIYDQICTKIFSFGLDAIPILESSWENSFNNLIQKRSLDLIHEIQFQNTYIELNNWSHFQFADLLKGYILVSKYNYPDMDTKSIEKKINTIIQDVWLEINNELTGLEKVRVINHILFDVHKLRGNKKNFYSPDNFFINNVLDTKLGNPLSLGLIYLIVCQSLKIPIYGINLPNHFTLAYVDGNTIKKNKEIHQSDVLFYLKAFNIGAVFTKNEIDLFLKQMKLEQMDDYYRPRNHLTIINRLLSDLIFSYDKIGYKDKVLELKKLQQAVS